MGRARGAKVIVALHLSRDERMASPQEGHDYFVRQAKEAGVTPVELGISFESARQRAANPYLDHIHPNALGHALIADALLLRITSDLRD